MTKTKKINNNYKNLYQQIYNVIPKKFFVNKEGLEDCAIAIYLTATFDDAQRERERERENQFRAREAATRWYVW